MAPVAAQEPSAAIHVAVTFAPDLAVPARIAVIEQATEIWAATGLAIDWQPGGERCEPGRCIRALVVRRPRATRNDELARQVGELVRLDGGGAAMIVSVDEAERIVRQAPPQRTRFGLVTGDALGIVLGRAVAHELGHYLLDTATHARHGLMRPRFEPGEFTALRSTAFTLDDEALAWLHAHVGHATSLPPFAYR